MCHREVEGLATVYFGVLLNRPCCHVSLACWFSRNVVDEFGRSLFKVTNGRDGYVVSITHLIVLQFHCRLVER